MNNSVNQLRSVAEVDLVRLDILEQQAFLALTNVQYMSTMGPVILDRMMFYNESATGVSKSSGLRPSEAIKCGSNSLRYSIAA